jgi:two-component system, cell cycle response regulator DivK
LSSTLLLIEDNPNNAYLMRYLLEKAGYTVHVSAHGREGIEMALRIVPDALLLDIQLPEMDGYEVLSSIRSHRVLDRTPVIAVTSYAMAGDREKIMECGADGYIEKPIDPETFVAEITAHLAASPGREI